MEEKEWKEKLKAFMEGLEIEEIETFLIQAKVGDYRDFGKLITERIKEIRKYSLI